MAYSCNTASETLEWINAIIVFLKPFKPLMDAHVVNFFKDKLWESIDKEWMDCLRVEHVENLLKLPSGVVQDHWPASLKEFILTLRSLVLPRDQGDLRMMLPDLRTNPISSVLAQGMNLKKKHEVEILAAIVKSVAESVGAQTIVDVGAGQGYLAQVLAFQYQLSVVAIDASSHHGTVTNARAVRIKKHYAAKMRNSQARTMELNIPQTLAIHVLSSDTLKALSDSIAHKGIIEDEIKIEPTKPSRQGLQDLGTHPPSCKSYFKSSLVLAGLHACGDLSVTMLRTFLECKEVRALVNIGCCYNLISEVGFETADSHCGFPVSFGVCSAGFSLGKSARDLGCQSAERWKVLTKDAALQNFQLHAFRAAFQMVLHRYFPEVITRSPSIGRQGKALRRQQVRKVLKSHEASKESNSYLFSSHDCDEVDENCSKKKLVEVGTVQELINDVDDVMLQDCFAADGKACSTSSMNVTAESVTYITRCDEVQYPDGYSLFKKFCESGLHRLGLIPCQGIDIGELWIQSEPFLELIGPYWTLRACLGPLVETLLLLDRLLFLQEKGSSVQAMMVPIFDPVLSPRNVAIIAQKL
ncbi:S-adenosyl-l-methionine-dependent methyltransferases superfamily protein [Thalictrum thalictroides]|uniref:S-adenosyl-l-methionine-dependent methyltransferases superfamily protein n=1 Tax=Thalictrum thalictroides TaxID=46969 RepID=A0A7J6WPS1_THATH|nr:S-adenosyl-l-methionine-dependent methyltransferases superfamily protein [Thalictrum thalictroides]